MREIAPRVFPANHSGLVAVLMTKYGCLTLYDFRRRGVLLTQERLASGLKILKFRYESYCAKGLFFLNARGLLKLRGVVEPVKKLYQFLGV